MGDLCWETREIGKCSPLSSQPYDSGRGRGGAGRVHLRFPLPSSSRPPRLRHEKGAVTATTTAFGFGLSFPPSTPGARLGARSPPPRQLPPAQLPASATSNSSKKCHIATADPPTFKSSKLPRGIGASGIRAPKPKATNGATNVPPDSLPRTSA